MRWDELGEGQRQSVSRRRKWGPW